MDREIPGHLGDRLARLSDDRDRTFLELRIGPWCVSGIATPLCNASTKRGTLTYPLNRASVGGMQARESDERPWGGYVVLDDEVGHKVKRITVLPGQRLSYQRHEHRSEHSFVVAGHGVVSLDGEQRAVGAGGAVDVSAGTAHRIHNTGGEDLVFIEVQHGDYFGEDDIVRLDDDYGRTS